MSQDYYEILEISRNATQAEIKQTVQDQLNDVKAALIILSDQEKRQAYDELLEKMNSPAVPIQSKEPNKTTFRLLKTFTAIVILAMIAGGYWFVTGYTVPNSSAVTHEISVAAPPSMNVPKTAENKIIPPTTTESSKSVINQPIVKEVAIPIKTTEQNVPLITEHTENVENQTTIAEKQPSIEMVVKSPVTSIEQEKSVVTELVAATETVIAVTNTQATPTETTTLADKTVTTIQELPAKILYKDFFQQNKTIVITIALTNNLDKSIQFFDGIVTFYEQNDNVIGSVSLSKYDILKQVNKPNKYTIQKDKVQRWGLNINASQNAAIYTQIVNKRLTTLKIKFFLTEVTYTDGEKVLF